MSNPLNWVENGLIWQHWGWVGSWTGLVVFSSDTLVNFVCVFRTSGRPETRAGVHPEDVHGPERGQREDPLLSLHMRYRHREHPFNFRRREGHHRQGQPEGFQSSLN